MARREGIHTEEEVMGYFNRDTNPVKMAILEAALELAVKGNAGTKAYAIASAMGFIYQDDGTYLEPKSYGEKRN